MSEIKFASAGNTVKVWNTDFTLIEELKNINDSSPAISWSENNLYLSQLSSTQENIYLSSLSQENATKIITGEETKLKSCLCMDSSSRYVMAGGTDGLIHVWNIKNSKIRKKYKAPDSSITTLSYNHDDSIVAAGNIHGDLLLFNATSSILTVPSRPNSTKSCMKQLKFSILNNSLISSVSDEGGTHLWDAPTKKHLHEFKAAHSSPSTAVVFSPLNHLLMLTSGLDKKIICYDVSSKRQLKNISVSEPLTSLAILHDGTSILAGTSRGKVLLYDLRQAVSPINTVIAHNSAVHGLCVQTKNTSNKTVQDGKNRKKDVSVISSSPCHKQPLRETNATTNISKVSTRNSKTPKRVSIGDALISPCHDEENNSTTPQIENSNNSFNNNNELSFNKYTRDSFIPINRISDAPSSIFSPLSATSRSLHNSSISNHTFDQANVTNRLSMNTTRNALDSSPNISDLDVANNSEIIESENIYNTKDVSFNDIKNTSITNGHINTQISETFINNNRNITKRTSGDYNNNINNNYNGIANHDGIDNYNNISINNADIKSKTSNLNRYPLSNTTHNNDDHIPTHSHLNHLKHSVNNVEAWKGGSVEVLRNVVKEEVEEAMEPLHFAILNMHSEMVTKFHQLQIENQRMSQEHMRMQEIMLASYNRLSEENENLKFNLEYLS